MNIRIACEYHHVQRDTVNFTTYQIFKYKQFYYYCTNNLFQQHTKYVPKLKKSKNMKDTMIGKDAIPDSFVEDSCSGSPVVAGASVAICVDDCVTEGASEVSASGW